MLDGSLGILYWLDGQAHIATRGSFAIEQECQAVFKILPTRKETALYFQTQKHPAILFLMLDGKDYAAKIWRLMRPAFSKPFRIDS